MIDRLRQMAIFAKTIDHGSFRAAAASLKLSPSVVSHHISQLEDHLGVALLYRSTRKLTLTPEGARLLSATRNMLEAVEGELTDLSANANTPSGELRLTLPSVLSKSQFTSDLAQFASRHPRITLTLDFSDTRRELIDDNFDLAIRLGPTAKRSATSRPLFQVERKLVTATDYFDAHTRPTHPRELMDWDWLILQPAAKVPVRFQNAEKDKHVLRPTGRVFTNDAQALYRLARSGAGLAIVPDFLADAEIAAGTVTHVLPDWKLPMIHATANWPANAPKHGLIHLALKELAATTV